MTFVPLIRLLIPTDSSVPCARLSIGSSSGCDPEKPYVTTFSGRVKRESVKPVLMPGMNRTSSLSMARAVAARTRRGGDRVHAVSALDHADRQRRARRTGQLNVSEQSHRPAQGVNRVGSAEVVPTVPAAGLEHDLETAAAQSLDGDVRGRGAVDFSELPDSVVQP